MQPLIRKKVFSLPFRFRGHLSRCIEEPPCPRAARAIGFLPNLFTGIVPPRFDARSMAGGEGGFPLLLTIGVLEDLRSFETPASIARHSPAPCRQLLAIRMDLFRGRWQRSFRSALQHPRFIYLN